MSVLRPSLAIAFVTLVAGCSAPGMPAQDEASHLRFDVLRNHSENAGDLAIYASPESPAPLFSSHIDASGETSLANLEISCRDDIRIEFRYDGSSSLESIELPKADCEASHGQLATLVVGSPGLSLEFREA